MGLLQSLLQKVLERKLQKERQKYMRLEMQRAKLAGIKNVEKRNRENYGKSDAGNNIVE